MSELDDEHDEYLFCWKVHGTSDEFTGYMAEEEAKAVAKRIGGTAFAFALYVRPQPTRECIVKNCENHANQGRFVGDLCSPCHGFITTGEGVYSQAYRNAKREWVGLTDVEVGDALIDLPVLGNGYFLRISRAIEAKLKEKNT